MLRKFAWLIFPVALLVVFSVSGEVISGRPADPWLASILLAANGLIGGTLVLVAMRWLSGHLGVQRPSMRGFRGLAVGGLMGLGASLGSGLFALLAHPDLQGVCLSEAFRARSLVANISPALVEEGSMRAGVVNLTAGFAGRGTGLLLGSIPFGLVHLVGLLFGKPVTASQVLGTTMAGLLLSILYLRFGFWAAFASHWAWNSLAGFWVRLVGLPSPGGINTFEGAPETVAVLTGLCLILWLSWPNRPRLALAKAIGNSGAQS